MPSYKGEGTVELDDILIGSVFPTVNAVSFQKL